RWKQRGTDVVVASREIPLLPVEAILLLACYLEAVPVLTGRPPYELGPEHGVLWADGTAEGYELALVLASDPEPRQRLIQSLNDYCATTLTPDRAHATLMRLLEGCPKASPALLTSRLRALLF